MVMTKYCILCGVEIPPKRIKILPQTKHCVNCSDTAAYKAVSVTCGEGEDTWNEIRILDDKDYENYLKVEKQINKIIKQSIDLTPQKSVLPEEDGYGEA